MKYMDSPGLSSNSRSGKIDIALVTFKFDLARIGEERQQMTATGFPAVAN